MNSIFKRPFLIVSGLIVRNREGANSYFYLFLLDENHLLYQAARSESGREARETVWIAPLALSSSERRPRLALASGFWLFRLLGDG